MASEEGVENLLLECGFGWIHSLDLSSIYFVMVQANNVFDFRDVSIDGELGRTFLFCYNRLYN